MIVINLLINAHRNAHALPHHLGTDELLVGDSLSPDSFVHETTSKAKALQAAWRHMVELSAAVGRGWSSHRLPLQVWGVVVVCVCVCMCVF